ncbi:MAG: flagellar protein FlgN [Gammaproteobacteria bacterium]|nr:flagellar protein FlgN [Gammaproteobacteria bacterium]
MQAETQLAREVDALRVVLATLQTEKAALLDRAPDALFAASTAKAEAVAVAARLGQERHNQSVVNPATRSPGIKELVDELKQLATECRQQNEANGMLIRGQRRRIEGSLNVLRGGIAAPDTYGRDGETRPMRILKTPLASY